MVGRVAPDAEDEFADRACVTGSEQGRQDFDQPIGAGSSRRVDAVTEDGSEVETAGPVEYAGAGKHMV